MHGLLVKLSVVGDTAQYNEMFTDYAKTLNERDGFVMKTWITSESMVGGFYIFDDQQLAQRYLDEMLIPTVAKYDAFTVQDVQHFPILDTFSEINHSPVRFTATSAHSEVA